MTLNTTRWSHDTTSWRSDSSSAMSCRRRHVFTMSATGQAWSL